MGDTHTERGYQLLVEKGPAELAEMVSALELQVEQLQAENERLSGALTEIKQLKSHRHPCCPTNLPKGIANEALQESRDD